MQTRKAIALVLGLGMIWQNTWAVRDHEREEVAQLTHAPNVPPPITRDYAARVQVELETVEKVGRMADGVEYTYWTFGGTVPGPMIRVREGDMVDFKLHNHPTSKMPHNIDLHAVTGPWGGAAASLTAPGHTSRFGFKVLNPGSRKSACFIWANPFSILVLRKLSGLPRKKPDFPVSF